MKEQPALPFSIKPFQGPTLVHVLLFKNKKQRQQQQNTAKQINPQTFKSQKCCFLKRGKKNPCGFHYSRFTLRAMAHTEEHTKAWNQVLWFSKKFNFPPLPCCGQGVWNELFSKAPSKTNHFGIFWVKLWPGCTYPVYVACVLGRYGVYEQRIMESQDRMRPSHHPIQLPAQHCPGAPEQLNHITHHQIQTPLQHLHHLPGCLFQCLSTWTAKKNISNT